MKREFTVVIEQGEDGYLVGSVPSLPGCLSQAKTVDELLERMRDAIQLWLEEFGDGTEVSDPPLVDVLKVAV